MNRSNHRLRGLLAGAMIAALSSSSSAGEVEWNARTAEHLLNRAGFGASPEQVARTVAMGLDAAVDALLEAPVAAGFQAEREFLRPGIAMPEVIVTGPEAEEGLHSASVDDFYLDKGELRRIRGARDYSGWWIQRMIDGTDPLRDRLAIFWHGHFVSSTDDVDSLDIVEQLEFLRTNALGSFEDMVRGIARDPAMLEYLNNNINEKSAPNENWARELMELFTLGDGHYTEDDIKEAARAYTGWTNDGSAFWNRRGWHDYGPKTILGVTGNLEGDGVIDILLREEQCGRFIAGKLIAYLEGVAPSPERVVSYGKLFADSGYEVSALVGALLRDPEFYRDEVLGTRIAAPVEYFVGTARRLGIQPPPNLIWVASAILGQKLLAPPNVKGWEEGVPWMTTGSVMERSNLVSALIGEVGDGVDAAEAMREMVDIRGREFHGPYRDYLAMVAWFQFTQWQPSADPAQWTDGAASDEAAIAALLDRFLAVPAAEETRAQLLELVSQWRAQADLSPKLTDPEASALLDRLVHVILSLPEAQLI